MLLVYRFKVILSPWIFPTSSSIWTEDYLCTAPNPSYS